MNGYVTPRLAQRWHLCCDPLIGVHCGVTIYSPTHKAAVTLWMQTLADGSHQVDANVPRLVYRQLFKERFTDEQDAREFWREQYAELFGHEWEL